MRVMSPKDITVKINSTHSTFVVRLTEPIPDDDMYKARKIVPLMPVNANLIIENTSIVNNCFEGRIENVEWPVIDSVHTTKTKRFAWC